MNNKNTFNYENRKYLRMLNRNSSDLPEKYLFFIKKYLKGNNSPFLDVGCGNGSVLIELAGKGYSNLFGCDVSSLFLNAAKKERLKNLFLCDGHSLPFPSDYFDVIGSFTVLEHTDNPSSFLLEQIRVVKKSGVIITACPNFLSPFYSFSNPRFNTFLKRIINLPKIIGKFNSKDFNFEKVEPIIRKDFQADDDMITVTNLIDIQKFFRKNKCKILYSSGFISKNNFLFRFIESIPAVKFFLPSCFLVAEKC